MYQGVLTMGDLDTAWRTAWATGRQPSAIIQDHYFFTGVQ